MSAGPAWKVIGESVAGTSHRARNTPCQDSFAALEPGHQGGPLTIAVADGAGSAEHSEFGATFICQEFTRLASKISPELLGTREMATQFVAELRDSLLAAAKEQGFKPREVACTALFAHVGPTCSTFIQIGDGAIVINGDLGYEAIFWPEPTEYANTTDFVTDDAYHERLLVQTIHHPIRELAIITDGLQRVALDFGSRKPHSAFFRPLFAKLRSASDIAQLNEAFRKFLDSDRINDRTDDDKTLVLAIQSHEPT